MGWSATIETSRLTPSVLDHLCEALARIDVDHLRAAPSLPSLYRSGVRYRAEPPGSERWADIPTILARGGGDCEDLTAWRVAELRMSGEVGARATSIWQPTPQGLLVHVLVRRGDGRLEDPSRLLGMP